MAGSFASLFSTAPSIRTPNHSLLSRASQPSKTLSQVDLQALHLILPAPHFGSTGNMSSVPLPNTLVSRFPAFHGMHSLAGNLPFSHGTHHGFNPLYMTSVGVGIPREYVDLGSGDSRNGNDGYGPVTGWINNDPYGDADTHYQRLLQSDPQNPLLLQNYAEFLLHARQDVNKAEELYERAILACPDDGRVLARYAELLWNAHRDSDRAGMYFEQAVEASPDDCYVAASYASFLWQSGEDDGNTKPIPPLPQPLDVIRLMQAGRA